MHNLKGCDAEIQSTTPRDRLIVLRILDFMLANYVRVGPDRTIGYLQVTGTTASSLELPLASDLNLALELALPR